MTGDRSIMCKSKDFLNYQVIMPHYFFSLSVNFVCNIADNAVTTSFPKLNNCN